MSLYLIDESPIMFQPSLACRVGINEAIFLQQLHYWVVVNRKQQRNLVNGRYWVYNTLSQWLEQFPFWSESTLRRTIGSLKDKSILLVGFFSNDKRNRTAWYSIDYNQLTAVLSDRCVQNGHNTAIQNESLDVVNLNTSSIQEINNTEITTENSKGRACETDKFDAFVECYNQHKPVSFTSMTVVNPARRKKLENLIRDCGGVDNALVALANALRYAQVSEWCKGKDLTFENFASNDKILQYHERWVERSLIGAPPCASDREVQRAREIADLAKRLSKT